jgi:hypothetical protein
LQQDLECEPAQNRQMMVMDRGMKIKKYNFL